MDWSLLGCGASGLVLYLVLTKRLFGVRGGKKAYEARLRSESILDAEIAALEAEQGVAVGQGVAAQPAAPGNPAPAAEAPAAEPPREVPAEAAAGPATPVTGEAPDASEAGVEALPPAARVPRYATRNVCHRCANHHILLSWLRQP